MGESAFQPPEAPAWSLSPTQAKARDALQDALGDGAVFIVKGGRGTGKSAVLRTLAAASGGVCVGVGALFERTRNGHPLAVEEALFEVMREAMSQAPMVVLDDLHLYETIIGTASYAYPRAGLVGMTLAALCDEAERRGCKLVFATLEEMPAPVSARAYIVELERFTPDDYRHICAHYLADGQIDAIDTTKLHRFAQKLTGYQLRDVCLRLRHSDAVDHEAFVALLVKHRMVSNVALGRVEAVRFEDLKGIDDVIRALETHVVLPFEHDTLAAELQLKPAQGVLLYGPPGTGKTSIGRALAHRLRGKFFRIDGTFINEASDFYSRVDSIFYEAQQSSPSIIFIDDTDVIWENASETGLYRYLLTKLDGLENDHEAVVCVILTAMNVGALPAALVRSGRMELWLELTPPDDATRRAILRAELARAPEPLRSADLEVLIRTTRGFTGADLKHLVRHTLHLYAYDRAKDQPVLPIEEYLALGVASVSSNRQKQERAVGFG